MNNMKEKLVNLKNEFLENLEKINSVEELENLDKDFLGKK
jgi:hypothetical protein